jgi:hypothetical protein
MRSMISSRLRVVRAAENAKVATVLFDPRILRHSGICGAADEEVLKNVHIKKSTISSVRHVPATASLFGSNHSTVII